MGPYFSVDADFWTDADVIDAFTPEDKYFYLYLLTSPHGNISGCFEVSLKQIAAEMGYSVDSIEHLVDRFVSVHKMIDYDADNKEILIHKWGKHHWTKSEKYIVALRRKIEAIKTPRFKKYLDNLLNWYESEDGKNTVWIPYTYGMDTTFLSFSFNNTLGSNSEEREEGGSGEEEREETGTKEKPVSPQDVVDLYNQLCPSFPTVKKLSEARKTAIRARAKTYSRQDFVDLFKKAEASGFLKGANDRNWSATFDWLIADRNMAKVLDGNYDGRGMKKDYGGSAGEVYGSGSEKRWRLRADVG